MSTFTQAFLGALLAIVFDHLATTAYRNYRREKEKRMIEEILNSSPEINALIEKKLGPFKSGPEA